jgi:hypothetical protein
MSLAASGAGENASAEESLLWKGQQVTIDELPDEVRSSISGSIEYWAPWCARSGYGVFLEQNGRVMLAFHKQGKDAERLTRLVDETLSVFDRFLPAVALDPQEDYLEAEWGLGEVVPDRDPVILFELAFTEHLASLLDHVGQQSPRLSSWANANKRESGFMYDYALSAAWLAAPPDVELGTVWRSENELVNRLARMLLRRRFGEQPHWLRQGMAWQVEQTVLGNLYSFPGRDEFISVTDHEGWRVELKLAFKKRSKDPLRMEEFADWRSGAWKEQAAHISWGLTRFLAEERPEALSRIAEDYRRLGKQGARVVHDDGTWELRPDYSIPIETQREVLVAHAGEDVFAKATASFRKGK